MGNRTNRLRRARSPGAPAVEKAALVQPDAAVGFRDGCKGRLCRRGGLGGAGPFSCARAFGHRPGPAQCSSVMRGTRPQVPGPGPFPQVLRASPVTALKTEETHGGWRDLQAARTSLGWSDGGQHRPQHHPAFPSSGWWALASSCSLGLRFLCGPATAHCTSSLALPSSCCLWAQPCWA